MGSVRILGVFNFSLLVVLGRCSKGAGEEDGMALSKTLTGHKTLGRSSRRGSVDREVSRERGRGATNWCVSGR